MFTGIIESLGRIREVVSNGRNQTFWLESTLVSQLKVDQSISHNGVCLTVEEIRDTRYRVTAVRETLKKTALGGWTPDMRINLERSLLPSSRLDGHFVQGHVDAAGKCRKIKNGKGSWEVTFSFPKKFAPLLIEKGSICVNGISLTAFAVKVNRFTVAVIPYTWQHTNLQYLKTGDAVNLEFDLLAKYLARQKEVKR